MGLASSSDGGCAGVLCQHGSQRGFGQSVTVQSVKFGEGGPPNTGPPSSVFVEHGVPATRSLTVPKSLPKLELSKPLSSDQRRELVDLQQQIQAQLLRQQALADSLQSLPEFGPGGAQPKFGVVRHATTKATHGPQTFGPNPDGDAPVLDPEFDFSEDGLSERPSAVPERPNADNPVKPVDGPPAPRAAPRAQPAACVLSPRPLPSKPVAAFPRPVGGRPPGREERRWIEAAVRRMFRSVGPTALDAITESFREWRLPAAFSIVQQAAPITSGPGLCVLFDGVIDVLHRPKGGVESEKVCTYDRLGQCFGELELLYNAPRGGGPGRKAHWATITTRTPATLWTVDREVLRGVVQSVQDQPRS